MIVLIGVLVLVVVVVAIGLVVATAPRGVGAQTTPMEVPADTPEVLEARELSTLPMNLVEVTGHQSFDKGIVNSYRQLTQVTLLNRARYHAVRDVIGQVTYFDSSGASIGSEPFGTVGSIPAGGTVRFSTDDRTLWSGTTQGEGVSVKIEITQLALVN